MSIRWIENVSWDDVKNGWHSDMGENSMLIQIADPATFFPEPKRQFKEIHRFEFLDAEDSDRIDDDFKISNAQAINLVALLQIAMENHMNVLVHCHAGICRSGAVVEVGTMMGFTATDRYRQPNLRVKHKMMKVLGLTYDEDEKHSSTGGWISAGGIEIPFSSNI
jgi:predicted protein tyrosine phosphatase